MAVNGILLNQNNNSSGSEIYKIQTISYEGTQTIGILGYSTQQSLLYSFKIPNIQNLIDLRVYITADSMSFIPSNSAYYSIGLYVGDDCLYKNTSKTKIKESFSLPTTIKQIKNEEISDIKIYLKGTQNESATLENFSLHFYAYYDTEPQNSLEDIKESLKYIFNPLLLSNNTWNFIKTQWNDSCRSNFLGNLYIYLDSRNSNAATMATFINKEAQLINPKSIYKADIESKYSASPTIKFLIQDSNNSYEYDIKNIKAGEKTTISFDPSIITGIDFSTKKYQIGLKIYAEKGTQIEFWLYSIYIE